MPTLSKGEGKFQRKVCPAQESLLEELPLVLKRLKIDAYAMMNDLMMCIRLLNGFIDLDFHEFFELNQGGYLWAMATV